MLLILEHGVKIDVNKYCTTAISGDKAVQIIKDNIKLNTTNNNQTCDYKLILMDCNMPGMDGYEATNQIRKYIQSCGLPQPIISACTGHTEQEYVDRAIESGMN